jgi:3',5'-cyclic AMP phosphodiesterase CpdA
MGGPVSRRELIGAGALMAMGLPAVVVRASSPEKRGIRLAHLTDMHVKDSAGAADGFAAALKSVAQLEPPPQFIVTGGDHVMDVMAHSDTSRARSQWELYRQVLRDNTSLEVFPVLGNHDIFAWGAKEPLPETDASFGKNLPREMLGRSTLHYSFDRGQWHFVVLDNIARRGSGYFGELDQAQTEWLETDLRQAGGRHVCVFSHIPLVSVCALFFAKQPKEFWRVGDNLLHRDVRPLLALLARHGVRLCVSGHIHLRDHVRFMGIDFVCDGAVSGSWWGGPFQHVPEGYGVFDLYDDGTFQHQYVTYGWQART